ncbi:MAG TPA: YibE/F family protein [Geobacteraceae bacterium]|nr:YibE/F family protein [Geobacteraceae bacterium]
MWRRKGMAWVYLVIVLLVIRLLASNFITDRLLHDKVALLYLVVIFLGSLVIVGGRKGLKTIVTLTVTVLLILKVLLPMILAGYNPAMVAILTCEVITVIALLFVSGFNHKTLAAIIGTTGGISIAGLLAFTIGSMAHLTGLGNEEAIHLILYSRNLDFRGLLFAGIIIGAMGAVMDVGISISSSIHEIKANNPGMATGSLVTAGMNVGRDIIGTMSNTLILAYVGSSLNLLLLLTTYEIPLNEIIGRDNLAAEIVRALAGSVGLIATIPITALTAGMLAEKTSRKA